jgi:hypothetical protein
MSKEGKEEANKENKIKMFRNLVKKKDRKSHDVENKALNYVNGYFHIVKKRSAKLKK